MSEADLSVHIGDLTLIAAPQAVRVLAKLPDVFAELAPQTETQTDAVQAAHKGLNWLYMSYTQNIWKSSRKEWQQTEFNQIHLNAKSQNGQIQSGICNTNRDR